MINIRLLIPVLLLLSNVLLAQTNQSLDEIVVEDSRLAIPFNKQSRNIEILTKQEIQRIPAQTINGVLQYIGGIDIRQRGANNVQADLSLRGSTFEQVLVMINGVKLTDPQTGHHILNLPIDINIIERIEIIKGPASRIYGQNAFAGAINIVTKVEKKDRTIAEVGFGKHKLFEGKVSFNKKNKSGKSRVYFAGANQKSRGYIANTDYSRWSFFAQNDIDWKKNQITLLGSYVDNGFGANSFYAAPYDSLSYENVKTTLLSASLKRKFKKGQFKLNVYNRFNHDNYILNRTKPSIYENNHFTNVIGADLGANYMLSKNITLAAGIEARSESIISNNLGEHDRNIISGFADMRFHFFEDRINITPGVAYHHYSDFGPNLFYGVDASIEVVKNIAAFGNIGTTYRIPTYTELYYSDRRNVGNPDLKPEEALAYEFGIKYNTKSIHATAAYFKREGSNIIDWQEKSFMVDTTEVVKWQPNNILKLNLSGFDGAISWRPQKVNFLSPLRIVKLSYTFTELEKVTTPSSRYALAHVANQFNFSTQWSILNILRLNTGVRYMDRVSIDDYWVFDLGFGVYLGKINFQTTINNVLNKEYEEYPGISMPKRWWKCSFTYRL